MSGATPRPRPVRIDAARAEARLAALARISASPDRLVRLAFTPEMRRAYDLVAGWMAEAGLAPTLDAAGNLVGRWAGGEPGRPALLVGSHLDTVVDAGRYDGMLGVVVGIEALAALRDAGLRPAAPVEVVAFCDEEGARFHTTYLGSRALAGLLPPGDLARRDDAGVSVAEAMAAFGLDPARLGEARRPRGSLAAYLEVHIEQGPVLEARGLPCGVVSAIASASRYAVTVSGAAGHAGTTPMDARRDALCGAAEAVLAVERVCRGRPGVVGTVGALRVEPGASNVIPGRVRFSLDVRAPDEAARRAALEAALAEAAAACAGRGLDLAAEAVLEAPAVGCAARLRALLAELLREQGIPPLELVSGAGHDAVPLSAVTDVGMLFVRCRGGQSHTPLEAVAAEDIAVAGAVLAGAVARLAA